MANAGVHAGAVLTRISHRCNRFIGLEEQNKHNHPCPGAVGKSRGICWCERGGRAGEPCPNQSNKGSAIALARHRMTSIPYCLTNEWVSIMNGGTGGGAPPRRRLATRLPRLHGEMAKVNKASLLPPPPRGRGWLPQPSPDTVY